MTNLIKMLKLFFLAFAIACIVIPEVAIASPGAVVAIEPAEVLDVPSGETFTVDITITDVTDLYGWQVNITFSPGVLNVASTEEGPFLKQVNETVVMKRVSNEGGFLLLSATYMTPFPTQGASGSGLLATVTFSVVGQGASSLGFVEGTKLRTVPPPYLTLLPITDYTTANGSFRNAAGGVELGIPLEWIVVILLIIVVIVVAAVFLVTRRRKGRSK